MVPNRAKHHILREKCRNTGKYGPEKTPHLDTFHVVVLNVLVLILLKTMKLTSHFHQTYMLTYAAQNCTTEVGDIIEHFAILVFSKSGGNGCAGKNFTEIRI